MTHCSRWYLTGALLCVFLMGNAVAQKPSRAEAIARIAQMYPNSAKSPEQIYDEGQIEMAALAFAKSFGNWELSALTGSLEEDSVRVIKVKKQPSVVRTPDPIKTTVDSTNRSGTASTGQIDSLLNARSANGDTTDHSEQMTETRRINRRSVFYSRHKVVTTVHQDHSEQDRRTMREDFLKIFKNLPSDVRILLKPIKTTYHGQTATVDAEWQYDILGLPTPASRPYVGQSPGTVQLRLRRVGDEWLVSNFQALLASLNR